MNSVTAIEVGARHGTPHGARKVRELRLDFFRGIAMFIILLAHTPNNTWTLWIPARFGFSDATEIFVFCSGFASALAFGSVFAKRGWLLGAARIAFRVWQVYWAHVGVFLVTAVLLFALDHYGLGVAGTRHVTEPYVVPLFERTGEALIGLLTLTYVPGLFDILPMYLVILAMVPVVMVLHSAGGRAAVAAFVLASWAAVNLAALAGGTESGERGILASLGAHFVWMNLPSDPFGEATWFFNPFGWQLVFFTGFAFGMRWLPAPPVRRDLIRLALAIVILSLPFAWYKIHEGYYLPADWPLREWIYGVRTWLEPVWWKPSLGLFRFIHFLAVAYLGWVAVGSGGERLRVGFPPPPAPGRAVLAVAAIVAVATIPYAYVDEIKTLAPALDRWLLKNVPVVPGPEIGLLELAHLVALVLLIWAGLGPERRRAATGRWFLVAVPVIRKVGTQSLAVFMVSIPLSIVMGWLIGLAGTRIWTMAAINLTGFCLLVGTAYLVSWFKSQPWKAAVATAPAGSDSRPPAIGGSVARAGRGA